MTTTLSDIDSALFAYTTLFARATTISRLQQDDDNNSEERLAIDEEDTTLGSFVVTLLFVPFTIYFGVVFFIFAIECYHFFSVWNLVSRTRSHNNTAAPSSGLRASSIYHNTQDVWNRRYHGLTSDDINNNNDDDEGEDSDDQGVKERKIQLCLDIATFGSQDINHSSKSKQCSDNCPICLCDFQANDNVATIRDCHCCQGANLFHHRCLTQWLNERPTCPYCRVEVFVSSKHRCRRRPPYDSAASPLIDSLEMASLQVEHYLCNAVTVFGEFLASYTY